ncbi:hypothetical protein BU17DRAFT_66053 [Hysterangium stoloniferum]|nr:hypothetical protein BU17DRAFT_66053 [Hysterangium stoloniferum]
MPDLPSELWMRIANQCLGKKDISNLACINRHIRSSLVSLVFKTLTFEGSDPFCRQHGEIGVPREYMDRLQRTQKRIRYLLESPHLTGHTRHVWIQNWVYLPDSIDVSMALDAFDMTFDDLFSTWKSTYADLTTLVASIPRLRTIAFIECDFHTPPDSEWPRSYNYLHSYDPCGHKAWTGEKQQCLSLALELPEDKKYRFRLLQDYDTTSNDDGDLEMQHQYIRNIFKQSQQDLIGVRAVAADVGLWMDIPSLSLEPFYSIRHLVIGNYIDGPRPKIPTAVSLLLAHCPNIQTLEMAESLPTVVPSPTSLPKLKFVAANYSTLTEILRHRPVETVRVSHTRFRVLPDFLDLQVWGHLDLVSCLEIDTDGYVSQDDLKNVSAAFHNLTHLMVGSLRNTQRFVWPTPGREIDCVPQQILRSILESVSIFPKLRIFCASVVLDMVKWDPNLMNAWNKMWNKSVDAVPTLKSQGHMYLEEIWISTEHKWIWVPSTAGNLDDDCQIPYATLAIAILNSAYNLSELYRPDVQRCGDRPMAMSIVSMYGVHGSCPATSRGLQDRQNPGDLLNKPRKGEVNHGQREQWGPSLAVDWQTTGLKKGKPDRGNDRLLLRLMMDSAHIIWKNKM